MNVRHPSFKILAVAWLITASATSISASTSAAPTGSPAAGSKTTSASNTPPAVVLDAKGLARRVSDLNIFDPDRQPRIRGESRPVTKPKPVVAADAPELGLVGVMTYPRGTFAFFDGNAAEFRKTLQVDAVIAGHALIAITPQAVTLSESNRPPIQLRVGQRLRKDSEGIWQPVAGGSGDAFTRSGGSNGNSSGGDKTSAAGAGGGTTPTSEDPPGSDEILKRLLKKREQEMK